MPATSPGRREGRKRGGEAGGKVGAWKESRENFDYDKSEFEMRPTGDPKSQEIWNAVFFVSHFDPVNQRYSRLSLLIDDFSSNSFLVNVMLSSRAIA